MQKQTVLNILFLCFLHVLNQVTTAAFVRSDAGSISQQLGFGIKRALFYLDALIEKCDNVGDLNQWLVFLDSYLMCDAQAYPENLMSTSLSSDKDSLARLNVLCDAWPKRSKCSSRLASKLNSCLGSKLENGRAGNNALRLTYAQMKFICRHKNEYIQNLDNSRDSVGDLVPIEKRPIGCFHAIKEPLAECINIRHKFLPQTLTFCRNVNLAKECLMKTLMETCKNEDAKHFMFKMLQQIFIDLKCSSSNGIDGA